MNDLVHADVFESLVAKLRGLRQRLPILAVLRKEVASNGPTWLPWY